MLSLRLPKPPPPRLVDSQRELETCCVEWSRCDALAIDTEWVRTRTFYPKLGLIQIGDPEGVFLIDALAVEDWRPLRELLSSGDIVKVLHSCSEDLEVLYYRFDLIPEALFDTQVAATICGLGASLSYQRLVAALFGLELDKGETRSNWLRRPLSPSQIDYAAQDVAYLLPMHEILEAELRQNGRASWAEEEFARLRKTAAARVSTDWAWSRLKKGRLSPRERAVLRALYEWREEQARERDLPRNFVIGDGTLIELARLKPTMRSQLSQVRGLGMGERRRSGKDILQLVRYALELPVDELDQGRYENERGRARGSVEALRSVVQKRAEEVGLPPEFLAQRRVLEALVRNFRSGSADPAPEELVGWRWRLLGDELLERLSSL